MGKIYKSMQTLLDVCAQCKKDEKILIITDPDVTARLLRHYGMLRKIIRKEV